MQAVVPTGSSRTAATEPPLSHGNCDVALVAHRSSLQLGIVFGLLSRTTFTCEPFCTDGPVPDTSAVPSV